MFNTSQEYFWKLGFSKCPLRVGKVSHCVSHGYCCIFWIRDKLLILNIFHFVTCHLKFDSLYLFWQWVKESVKDELVSGPVHGATFATYSQRGIVLCVSWLTQH